MLLSPRKWVFAGNNGKLLFFNQTSEKDDDEDFAASEDSEDEEETIAKQEKREKANYKAEIDELQAEGQLGLFFSDAENCKKNYCCAHGRGARRMREKFNLFFLSKCSRQGAQDPGRGAYLLFNNVIDPNNKGTEDTKQSLAGRGILLVATLDGFSWRFSEISGK